MSQKKNNIDVNGDNKSWVYSDIVKDHFLHPRYFVAKEKPQWDFDGVGEVGSPACGDVMRFWIKLSDDGERVVRVGWKTFGCASAIASTSILAEKLMEDGGMKVIRAVKIRPKDIIGWLGGLPENKIHCSVLGDQALRKAIENSRVNNVTKEEN
jgi:NifU-like protein involved in Fe-S cluster formation